MDAPEKCAVICIDRFALPRRSCLDILNLAFPMKAMEHEAQRTVSVISEEQGKVIHSKPQTETLKF